MKLVIEIHINVGDRDVVELKIFTVFVLVIVDISFGNITRNRLKIFVRLFDT